MVSVCFVCLSQSQGILYHFSIAAVINYCTLSSLTQLKFTISQSVGQKCEHRVVQLFPGLQVSHMAETGVAGVGSLLLGGGESQESAPRLFVLSAEFSSMPCRTGVPISFLITGGCPCTLEASLPSLYSFNLLMLLCLFASSSSATSF